MSGHILLRYKQKVKKLGLRSKLSFEDLSYLIAHNFDIKGKILGLKDSSDNFQSLKSFCSSNALKGDELYHVIVDQGDTVSQSNASNNIKNTQDFTKPKNNSNMDNILKDKVNQNQQKDTQIGLSSMITVITNFKLWENILTDPLNDNISLLVLVNENESQKSVNNVEWIGLMNNLVDKYSDGVDFFSCYVKDRTELINFKVFPSIVIYKCGQKVMEISLKNQTKTIMRLLEHFLNSAVATFQQNNAQNNSQGNLLMEHSIKPTEIDAADIITIPSNIPDQNELINIIDELLSNHEISTLDFFIFKCKILEKFDHLLRSFFENYRFILNSMKLIKNIFIYNLLVNLITTPSKSSLFSNQTNKQTPKKLKLKSNQLLKAAFILFSFH